MFDQVNRTDPTQLLPPGFASRPSLLPFLADHHLPYIVPAIVYWVISEQIFNPLQDSPTKKSSIAGFIFHYIDTRGLLSSYKLHTPAEDLTKNRATKKDVIKFALFQQACQCTLGYLTSGAEQYVPHEYGIAAWAQTIRYGEILAAQWMRYAGVDVTWIMNESKGHGLAPAAAFLRDTHNSHAGNFSQVQQAPTGVETTNISAFELIIAGSIYWIIVPLLQYLAVMIVADTFQYFTHRAFHVNRWLYSKHARSHDPICKLTDSSQQNTFTRCITRSMYLTPMVLSTITHWKLSQ